MRAPSRCTVWRSRAKSQSVPGVQVSVTSRPFTVAARLVGQLGGVVSRTQALLFTAISPDR